MQISFKEFWDFLATAFVRKTNVKIERQKLLNRKQRDRESLEQFWGALAEMAKKYDIAAGEEKWIRDFFINNMKNYDIQRKLLTEILAPREALNVELIDEKGFLNHLKLTNKFKSNGSSVHKPHSRFTVKKRANSQDRKEQHMYEVRRNFLKRTPSSLRSKGYYLYIQ